MTRLEPHWGTGVSVREATWGWRHDITTQIVNPDIDGLLTACLLHHLKGWPVVGFYDTQRLLIDPAHPLPLAMDEVVWVDVDLCWPGARSLSQHVVLDVPSDATRVSAYSETVNPSLLRGHARQSGYTAKYPFGTFQWAWWLSGLGSTPAPDDEVRTGLAWMPDGGFMSVRERWRANCVQWACEQLPGSILSPLASTNPDAAWDAVRRAEHELARLSGVTHGWSNHRFNLTRASAAGPRLNFALDEAPDVLQSLCNAICTLYGWLPPSLPRRLEVHQGTWRAGADPPPAWPDAANRHEVVSMAVTGGRRFCWTEPGALADVLGHPEPR